MADVDFEHSDTGVDLVGNVVARGFAVLKASPSLTVARLGVCVLGP